MKFEEIFLFVYISNCLLIWFTLNKYPGKLRILFCFDMLINFVFIGLFIRSSTFDAFINKDLWQGICFKNGFMPIGVALIITSNFLYLMFLSFIKLKVPKSYNLTIFFLDLFVKLILLKL